MRTSTVQRTTRETDIVCVLNLDGTGSSEIETGVGFFNHMLTALACHSRFDLTLSCRGDLDVDAHHTLEDCGLVLGEAIASALGERRGIRRFASAYAPLDEALARVVVDLSGRPFFSFSNETGCLVELAGDDMMETLRSLAMKAGLTLHIDLLRAVNRHHALEAMFKALALTLRAAVSRDGENIPSTKGVL